MNKRIIEKELRYALEGTPCIPELEGLKQVRTFADLGINGIGLVLFFKSGEQFRLAIKRGN